MTDERGHAPALTKYTALIDGFISGEISATEFEKTYLDAVKHETRMIDKDVFYVLQTLFEDADAFVIEPRLRTEPEDLDEDQLRDCARQARELLRNLGFR